MREVRAFGAMEIAAWRAYFELEWEPDVLADWHFAMLAHVSASLAGDKRSKIEKFMPPKRYKAATNRVQSRAEQIRILKGLTAGGKRKRVRNG